MATDVLLVKEGGRLTAADPISQESLGEVVEGEILTCTYRRARNSRFHRLFMALLRLVYENQTKYPTFNQLLDSVKVNIGYYDLVSLPNKVKVIKLRSISFGSMDETSFREFFNAAMSFLITDLIPGTGLEDLERMVLEKVDGPMLLTHQSVN